MRVSTGTRTSSSAAVCFKSRAEKKRQLPRATTRLGLSSHWQQSTRTSLENSPQSEIDLNHLISDFDSPILESAPSSIVALATTSTSAPATDVLGTSDIVVGTILALLLAGTASFLQGRRNQNDFVLWEKREEANINTTTVVGELESSETVVFDASSWKEMSQPDNYILYKTEIEKKKASRRMVRMEQRWVLVALLALFVPLFSVEFFFALSRQFICGDGPFLSQSSLAVELCSPVR